MGIFIGKCTSDTITKASIPAMSSLGSSDDKKGGKRQLRDLTLSDKERQVLYRTWTTHIRKNITSFGTSMFIKLFERNADIKKAFSQFRMLDTDNDMRSNASLESHALLVMNTIDEAVNLLDGDNATIKRLLYKAGKTHRRFPILQRNFFAAVEEPFMETIAESIGRRYTSEMQTVYSKFIQFVLSVVAEGFVVHS